MQQQVPSPGFSSTASTGPLSRRGALRLSLGGAAAGLWVPGMGWAAGSRTSGNAGGTVPGSAFADGLARGRPEAQGIAPAAILGFLDEARRNAYELQSFMLWRNGMVVAEGWWEPYRADRVHMMHSLTKSVTVTAVGLAMADGNFGMEDKVVSFFPEHLPATVSPNLAAMTVRDLLTMKTGHASMTSGSEWRPIKTSWIAEFFKIPVEFAPGSKFVYTSAATYMLSAIVTRTTGQSVADYLKPRFFDPLGISGYEWEPGPEGISPGANGLSWKTVDSLKLGILYAQGGQWNGRQVLPRAWVDAVHQPITKDHYGMQWWLNGSNNAFNADGLFGQYSVVFPEHNAALATTSAIMPSGGFLRTVAYKVFPAAFGAPRAPDRSGYAALQARTRALRLLPPPNPVGSPVAARVSGQRYEFKNNAEQVKAVSLDFSDDTCTFRLEDADGTHVVQAGLRSPREGDTTMPGAKLHHEYAPARMRVVAQGEWRDNNTFVMSWSFVESAFRDTVTCRFSGPHLLIDRTTNVNSGLLALPTLQGRMKAPA